MNNIFIFCSCCANGNHYIRALSDDGHFVSQHNCSSHAFISHDMGLTSDWKHAEYDAHYPAGWDLVLVDGEPEDHSGLGAAYAAYLARLAGDDAKGATS